MSKDNRPDLNQGLRLPGHRIPGITELGKMALPEALAIFLELCSEILRQIEAVILAQNACCRRAPRACVARQADDNETTLGLEKRVCISLRLWVVGHQIPLERRVTTFIISIRLDVHYLL